MAVSEDFQNYILDQLSEFGEVQAKKMFGGVGFFHGGTMFGMIGYGAFRLRVDEQNQPDFEAHGMEPLQSKSKGKGMPYWEVPAGVQEDKAELSKWARKAYQAALRGKKK